MTDAPTPTGSPCWADITAPDMATAQRFYGELFGWTFDDRGEEYGHYTMCLRDGAPAAALAPPMPGSEATPPAWSTYLATDDVDGALARVEERGGKILVPAMDVMTSGRMAYALDAAGAGFGLWQAYDFDGFRREGDPGTVGWNELLTPDGAAADAFYHAVFGYQEQEQVGDAGFDYTVWKAGDRQVCGRWANDDPPPRWLTYFSVADTDDAVAAVARLGGRMHQEPRATPYGRMALVSDPSGASFAVIAPAATS